MEEKPHESIARNSRVGVDCQMDGGKDFVGSVARNSRVGVDCQTVKETHTVATEPAIRAWV